jgi:hypothetical protein
VQLLGGGSGRHREAAVVERRFEILPRMRSDATSVDEYIASLPAERREAIATVRATVLEHLPEGYEEGIQYG